MRSRYGSHTHTATLCITLEIGGAYSDQTAGRQAFQRADRKARQRAQHDAVQIALSSATQTAGPRSVQQAEAASVQEVGDDSFQRACLGTVQITRWDYHGKIATRIVGREEAERWWHVSEGVWTIVEDPDEVGKLVRERERGRE